MEVGDIFGMTTVADGIEFYRVVDKAAELASARQGRRSGRRWIGIGGLVEDGASGVVCGEVVGGFVWVGT